MNNCDDTIIPALQQAITDDMLVSRDDGDCKVVVPIQRSDRDAIRLWVSDAGEGYRISDEGETYGFLYLSKINIDTDSRSDKLDSIKHRFNLDTVRKTISLSADEGNLGERLLDAIQAVQAVSYLSYTRKQYTQVDFQMDVGGYLQAEGYSYERNITVSGLSEDVHVDFRIKHQRKPTYLEALHAEDESTSTNSARRTAYKWNEIRASDDSVQTISVLDDTSGETSSDAFRILENWSDTVVPWSKKSRLTEVLES